MECCTKAGRWAAAIVACGLLAGCAQVGTASMAAQRGGSQFAIGGPAAYAPDPKTDPEGAAAMEKASRCAAAASRVRQQNQQALATAQTMAIAGSIAGLAGPAGAIAAQAAQLGANVAQRQAMAQVRDGIVAECM